MKRALLMVALVATQPTCANHPALTVGIGGGAVGLASCEIQGGAQSTCGIITGAVALGLGGLAWLVTTFADTNAHELTGDDEMLPDGAVRVHTHTDLPPVPLDAGVPDAAPIAPDATESSGSGSSSS
ncbi:MAG TPA: hypothetical protein VF403_19970 [Kofleriaceae bacterium]